MLIDAANAHLNKPLLFSPSRERLETPLKSGRGREGREIEELKERLARAESQVEKARLKMQQMKLKKQNVQGELADVQK